MPTQSLTDQLASAAIARRRRSLSLPHSALEQLQASLELLSTTSNQRAWLLPESPFRAEVEHYSARSLTLGLKGPRPKLRDAVTPELAKELALKTSAGLNFAELGASADPLVRPILLYYSCAHLCGVYSRAFFDWTRDSRSHGITCSHDTRDPKSTSISFEESGQFSRVATTCFVFSGQASPFSPLVTYSTSPLARTEQGDLLANFGRQEAGSPLPKLTLGDLLNFDFAFHLGAVRSRHGYHKFRGLPSTAFLVDLAILFLASSLARYDVLGWKRILDGLDNSFRIQFDEAFDRYLNFGIDAILRAIESPLVDFDHRLTPSCPSPYSHDDRSRFSQDVNAV